MGKVPSALNNRLGLAVAQKTYAAYREFLNTAPILRTMNRGARPQRLLWASTGTKNPQASDVMYICNLVAPYTINTMPEKTLLAFADHGDTDAPLSPHGGDAEATITAFAEAGIDCDGLAQTLQKAGAAAFADSWNHLLATIAAKGRFVNA